MMLSILWVVSSKSMETDLQGVHYIIIPGQNGKGGADFLGNCVINTANWKGYNTLMGRGIDFGQSNCIADFERQYREDNAAQQGGNVICAVSQGTSTVVNALARKLPEEQEKIAKCLVLESVLESGDSAIRHTMFSIIGLFPFSRLWIPLLAPVIKRVLFPAYKSNGPQLISLVSGLSPKIPVIIMHDKNDPQLPIDGARRAYHALRTARVMNNESYDNSPYAKFSKLL